MLYAQVHAVQCDVRDPKSVEAAVDQLVAVAGLPDVRGLTASTHMLMFCLLVLVSLAISISGKHIYIFGHLPVLLFCLKI